jgi:hypothetical protein
MGVLFVVGGERLVGIMVRVTAVSFANGPDLLQEGVHDLSGLAWAWR